MLLFFFLFFFFFFQAEDGIRDLYVTGVQTCALPIYRAFAGARLAARGHRRPGRFAAAVARSEEHTSELQSRRDLVCRLLLEKKKKKKKKNKRKQKEISRYKREEEMKNPN